MTGFHVGSPRDSIANPMSNAVKPIYLRSAVDRQTRADDAGVDIIMTRLVSRVPIPAPYDNVPHRLRRERLGFVPPLAYYCITALCTQTLDMDDTVPELVYVSNKDRGAPDILKALIPFYDTSDGSVELKYVPPNLWLTLAMLYASTLPVFFRILKLPLEDRHVPRFQTIQPLPRFTLITTLNLSSCSHLTDHNISDLRGLHQLAYLDLSRNTISSKGIHTLSRTLCILDGESEAPILMGPWKLRVLYLNNCPWIDDKVGPFLSKWPLLCLVDLQDTACSRPYIPAWPVPRKNIASPISLSSSLFPPTLPVTILRRLHSQYPDLFPHKTEFPYVLAIHDVDHQVVQNTGWNERHRPTVPSGSGQDIYAVVPSSSSSHRHIEVGQVKTEAEEEFLRRQRARDEAERREQERRSIYDDEDGYPWESPWGGYGSSHSDSDSDHYHEAFLSECDEEWDVELDTEEELLEMDIIADREWEKDVADQKLRDFYTSIDSRPANKPFPSLPVPSRTSAMTLPSPPGTAVRSDGGVQTTDQRKAVWWEGQAVTQSEKDRVAQDEVERKDAAEWAQTYRYARCILSRRPPPFTETLANVGKASAEDLELRESEEHTRLVLAGEAYVGVKRKRPHEPNSRTQASTSASVKPAEPLGSSDLWRSLQVRHSRAAISSSLDDVLADGPHDQELPARTRMTPFGRSSTSRVPAAPKPLPSVAASRRPPGPPVSITRANSKAPVLISSSHEAKRKPPKAATASSSKPDANVLPITKKKKLSQGNLRSFFKSSAHYTPK